MRSSTTRGGAVRVDIYGHFKMERLNHQGQRCNGAQRFNRRRNILQRACGSKIINSKIHGNSARHGGGIGIWHPSTLVATATIRNSSIYSNSATDQGGGIFFSNVGQRAKHREYHHLQ